VSSSLRLIMGDQNTGQQRAVAGRSILAKPVLRVWLWLALLGLVAGVCWRLTGAAPTIPQVLDVIGLALWLAAGLLKNAWDNVQLRQARHLHNIRVFLVRLASADYIVGAGVLLSLAPCAVLLAYNPRALVTAPILYEEVQVPLTAGVWLLASLLVVGPSIVIASLVLLQGLQALAGRAWGTMLWLLIAPLAHAPLVLGVRLSNTPLTLGHYADWVANKVAETQRNPVDLIILLKDLFTWPVLIIIGLWVLLGLVQHPARPAGSWPYNGWLVAFVGPATVSIYTALQFWHWTQDTARQVPGDWLGTFSLGLVVVWLSWWVVSYSNKQPVPVIRPGDSAWLLTAIASWALLGYPHIVADQISQAELLVAATVAFPLALLGILLIHRVARAARGEHSLLDHIALVAVLAGLLLPVAWDGNLLSPALILHRYVVSLLLDATLVAWGCYITAALFLAVAVLWPWPPRRAKRRRDPIDSGVSLDLP